MNSATTFILKLCFKLYTKIFGKYQLSPLPKVENPEKASEMIYNLLLNDKPCMIARFGAFELAIIINYLGVKQKKHSYIKYIKGKQSQWWWNKKLISYLCNNAGFFPPTQEKIEQFCELMLNDIKNLDILESWRADEYYLKDNLSHCLPVTAEIMGPFFLKNPWTRALKGKKVLVVHPFSESIKSQYKNREHLFSNPDILPEFELHTIKAVQSIGGNSKYGDWFMALEDMKQQINNVDYDICIIGCGAYGFPLAAHVKRMGKKAIHLAGMTQLLFGIWGARWEKDNYSKYDYKALLNSYWVRPSAEEKPESAQKVEGGCYW